MGWVNPSGPPRLVVCYLTWKLEFLLNIFSVVAVLKVWWKKKKKHTQNNMVKTVFSQNEKFSFCGVVFYT